VNLIEPAPERAAREKFSVFTATGFFEFHGTAEQGDQIGRILAYRAIVCFGYVVL
jgi:hypothetical protein